MKCEKETACYSGRACMLATTPYQILGCIALVKQLHLDADLYIGNLFQSSEEVSRKLGMLHIFRNIVLIDEKNIFDESIPSKIIKRLKQIPVYMRLNRVVESFLLKKENYDQVYISNNTLICRLTYLYLYRKNRNIRVVYYDDGLGSYCNEKIMGISKVEQLYWWLFVGCFTRNITFSARFYKPKLYMDIMENIHNFISIDSIMTLDRNLKSDEIMRTVFSVSETCKIQEAAVVLDTIRSVEFNPMGEERIADLYNILNDRYKGALIFKQHPKDFSQNEKYTYFQQRQTPFEAVCYFANLSEKLLITNMSTAAFTPKILFDQEPVIVSLYGIMKEYQTGTNSFEKLFHNFQAIYTEPDRMHMPQDIDELISVLDRYLRH